MTARPPVGLLLAALAAAAPAARAQDNHHNTHQFGSRSSLYGGAVVGGARDSSAGYYNPAGLAFVENENISVSGSVYRFGYVSLHDGAGTGEDLSAVPVEQFPGILSGVVRFDSLPGHTFGYTLLTRHRFSLSATARVDDIRNVIDDSYEPGAEDFIGQFGYETHLDELWGGPSWALRLGDEWAVGATAFLCLRNQDLAYDISARAVGNPSGQLHSTNAKVDVEYLDLRLLGRLGVAWGSGDTRVGLALTTPGLHVSGRGTVFGDMTVQELDVDGNGTPEGFTANGRQDGLPSQFRTPLSLSLGIEQRVSDWTFAAGMDWHGRQGWFKILQPEPDVFIRPSGVGPLDTITETLRVTYEARSVLNAGVAADCALHPRLRGIVSFRTDYGTHVEKDADDGSVRLGTSPWDLFHLTAGLLWRKEDREGQPLEEIGIGVVYSFGRDRIPQAANFADASEANFLMGTPHDISASYDAIGFLIGYTKYF